MIEKLKKHSLLLILLLAVILCFWGINFGLPQLLHDDEQAFVKRALRFGSGDLNPHFFFYPTLYMYILFVCYGAYFAVCYLFGIMSSVQEFAHSYIRDPSAIYLIGRSISALGGVLAVYLTYRIGKKIYDKHTGIIAGIILIAIPKHIEISHYVKSDTFMLSASLLFFLFCIKVLESKKRLFYILAGFTLGIASALKYNAAAAVPVLVVAHFLSHLPLRKAYSGARSVKDYLPLIFDVNLILFGVFMLIGFTVGMPYWLIDFPTFSRHFVGLLNFTATDTEFGRGGGLARYLLLILNLGESRPLLGLLFYAGIIYFFVKKYINSKMTTLASEEDKRNRRILVFAAFIVVFLVCIRQSIQQWQYLYPAFPYLALMSADFIRGVYEKLKLKNLKILFGLVVMLILTDTIMLSALNNYYLSGKDTRQLAKEWVEENIPQHAKILLDIRGPQLLRSRELIKKQYELAVALNHPKQDYFKLQLESQRGKEYWHYHIERAIVTPPEAKEYSQKVELNEKLDLSNPEILRKKGFEYVIIAPQKEPSDEEKMLDLNFTLLKEFVPKRYAPPLIFRVKIYSLK